MSHIDPGPLASYNSLSDPNLSAYFNNSRMRKHLIKTGLVTRRGEIVSEKVFRLNNARKEHQRHVRDLLAQAIVHKALDMERHRQMRIKKQLEEIGKIERVRRVRADRALRGDEDILPLLSAPSRGSPKKFERPNTAPPGPRSTKPSSRPREQVPQSIGYPVIPGDAPFNTRSTRITTPYPNVEVDNQYLSQLDQEALRTFTLNLPNYDLGSGVSPYIVPVLDPASREMLEKTKSTKRTRKRLKKRPATAPVKSNKKEKEFNLSPRSNKHSLELHRREPPMIYKKQPRSLCLITFKYLGQIVNLDRETEDARDEIVVDQQHCGGGNLCVYKGKLMPGNNFTIISQRHRGYPFSLTFYLNGIIVERLSACCEYKHRKGFKLGAKTSHFAFVKIEGTHPCYKCLVASEKFRTTSDQSALARNTFKKRDENPEEEKSLKTPSYSENFTSSSESSPDSSSVSGLTPVEDEKISSASESTVSQTSEKGQKTKSKPASVASKSSKSSTNPSSTSGLSDTSTGERTSTPKSGTKTPTKSNSSTGSNSSSSSFSDDEEETIIHPEPTLVSVKLNSMVTEKGKIDLSHFALSDSQVEELCEILIEDSLLMKNLSLYNCKLSIKNLNNILKTVSGSCSNIKYVNIGRNNGISVNSLLQLVEKTEIETLILDDNYLDSLTIKMFMSGLKALYDPQNKHQSSSDTSFHQLTLIPAESSTFSDDVAFNLRMLSLNRTGLGKEGINGVAKFLSCNPPLTELHLNGNSLTGETIQPLWDTLSSGKNNNLVSLSLSSNRLSDHGMEKFADAMADESVLEKITFTKNSITDNGATHLVRFAEENSSVKQIFVSLGNTIKRNTLKQIKTALNDNKLKQ